MRYKEITKYIDFFKESSYKGRWTKEYDERGNSFVDVIYSRTVLNFIKDFKSIGFMQDDSLIVDEEELSKDLKSLDTKQTIALLSLYINREKVSKGLLLSKIESGAILELLKNLKKSDDERKIQKTPIKEKDKIFDDYIISLGKEYYENNAVEYVERTSEGIFATVYGTENYSVNIDLEGNKITDMHCSCPYYLTTGYPCKHMYAALECVENNEYNIKGKKKIECPKCKAEDDVVEIVYGYPSEEIKNRMSNKKIKWGGNECRKYVFKDRELYYKWHCNKCRKDILNTGELNLPVPLTFLGKMVNVIIDSPIGSKHPKRGFLYLTNYGYVPGTMSGDGEELDCYVLGDFAPKKTFTGQCIAVINRYNDVQDKLVVVPVGKEYTNDQIKALTEYQERFYDSEIIR